MFCRVKRETPLLDPRGCQALQEKMVHKDYQVLLDQWDLQVLLDPLVHLEHQGLVELLILKVSSCWFRNVNHCIIQGCLGGGGYGV